MNSGAGGSVGGSVGFSFDDDTGSHYSGSHNRQQTISQDINRHASTWWQEPVPEEPEEQPAPPEPPKPVDTTPKVEAPLGTITLAFTDIQSSTWLWEHLGEMRKYSC